MMWSDYIDLLVRWLRASGVKVHLHAHDLPFEGGLYRSETREVFVNCPNARTALLVLAHEAGHWLGYEVFGERPHACQRERQAYVFGWRVLVLIGADRAISRKAWIAACRDGHRRFLADDVDTSGVLSRNETP